MLLKILVLSFSSTVESEKISYHSNGEREAGENGIDGAFCERNAPERFNAQNSMLALNRYKSYVREHLATNARVSNLTGFLEYLNENENINKLYNTTDLIDDFENMEIQYFRLRKNLPFVSFYNSFRDRVANYSRILNTSNKDELRAVNVLYAAVASRLFAIKSYENHVGVVDLVQYMNIIENQIKNLQEMKKTDYINEYRDEYGSALDSKIQTANELIENIIIPQINQMYEETDNKIKELVTATIELQGDAEENLEKAKENRETLKTKLMFHRILAPVKLIGSILSVLGPVGTVVGGAITNEANQADKVIDSTFQIKAVSIGTGLAKEQVQRITEQANHNFELLNLQLKDLETILSVENATELQSIANKVNVTKNEVEATVKPSAIPNSIDINQIQERRNEISQLIGSVKNFLSNQSNESSTTIINVLDRMDQILTVGQAGLDVYKQIHNDKSQMSEVEQTIRQVQDDLNVVEQYEQIIMNIMIPQLKLVEQSINEAIENSANAIHVELDVSKWMVQSSLNDIKKLFHEMTQNFAVDSDLERCIEKINEGITTIIDVYDRIDSYTEKANLANLIADIAIGADEINDPQLKTAVSKMEQIVNSNLVMEQYEAALQALKQHKFPFAEHFISHLNIPSDLSSVYNKINSYTVNQINELIKKLRSSKELLEHMDSYSQSNFEFDAEKPFYKWNRQNSKNEIVDLFNGNDVIFVADIKKGLDFSAVKFNEIWTQFKLKNETVQKHFDSVISNFRIKMKMVGNNFYRCDKRVYYISLKRNDFISFSLRNGRPVNPNDIYMKLKNADAFLSPYTTWMISIERKNGEPIRNELKEFGNYVDEMSLVGYGSYVSNSENFMRNFCDEHLDEYYKLDHIEFPSKSLYRIFM